MVGFNPHRRFNLLGKTQQPRQVFRTEPMVIPAKGAESLGMSKALKVNLRLVIEDILNRCAKKDRYFIVVKCNLLPGRHIQNKVLIVNPTVSLTPEAFAAKCKTFNTMCFFVDNRRGTIEDVWILPKDTILSPEEIAGQGERFSERIGKSAEDMPILYG